MSSRTTGAIATRPTGNEQLRYYVSASRVDGCLIETWTTLAMPADVIDRVHVLARRSPAIGAPRLVLGDRNSARICLATMMTIQMTNTSNLI